MTRILATSPITYAKARPDRLPLMARCYNPGMPNDIYALFDTTEGQFKVKLHPDKTPRTVENFVSLAEGTKTGKPFYDGTVFHRVIPKFMIQGGDPEGTGRGGPGYKFADEFHPSLRSEERRVGKECRSR